MATKGIYKSTTELSTVGVIRPATGFDAWPASAVGRQIAIGRSIGNRARILYCLRRAAPAEVHFAWRTFESNFNKKVLSQSESHFRCRPATSLVWFIFIADGATTAFDTIETWRTKDGGNTWALLAAPATNHRWQDIQRAADGRLWGVTMDSVDLSKSQVWYSDDDGDSWASSNSRDVTGERRHTIAAHPIDGQRIAVFAEKLGPGNDDDIITTITADRGNTWSVNIASGIKFSLLGFAQLVVSMLPNDRMICAVASLSPSNPKIFISDDDGISWQVKKDFGTTNAVSRVLGPAVSLGGARMYVQYIKFDVSPRVVQVWLSVDGGNTWDDLDKDPPHPDTPAQDFAGGIAVDSDNSALYLGGDPQGNTEAVLRLSPVNASGIWSDLSDNIEPVALQQTNRTNNIAVIP